MQTDITTDPKPVSTVLKQGRLQFILNQTNKIKTANEIFPRLIGKKLATHCFIMNINNDTLVFAVDNAAWATQLRFKEAELLKNLRSHPLLNSIKKIAIKIRPSSIKLPQRLENTQGETFLHQ